jgi:hypothetical protein
MTPAEMEKYTSEYIQWQIKINSNNAEISKYQGATVEAIGDYNAKLKAYNDDLAQWLKMSPEQQAAEAMGGGTEWYKQFKKETEDLNASIKVLNSSSGDLTTAQQKQAADLMAPPPKPPGAEAARADPKAEQLGRGLVKGIFQELGFPDVFGKPFTEWGIVRLMQHIGNYGLDILNRIGKAEGPGGLTPGGQTATGGVIEGLGLGVMGLPDIFRRNPPPGAAGTLPPAPGAVPAVPSLPLVPVPGAQPPGPAAPAGPQYPRSGQGPLPGPDPNAPAPPGAVPQGGWGNLPPAAFGGGQTSGYMRGRGGFVPLGAGVNRLFIGGDSPYGDDDSGPGGLLGVGGGAGMHQAADFLLSMMPRPLREAGHMRTAPHERPAAHEAAAHSSPYAGLHVTYDQRGSWQPTPRMKEDVRSISYSAAAKHLNTGYIRTLNG